MMERNKKNIVVVSSAVPFYFGGNERLVEYLSKALKDAGYNAWPFFTPRNQYDKFTNLIAGYVANRFTDLKAYPWQQEIHQIISFAYPSFAIPHPVHVSWFNHRMREYYDLWPRWIALQKTFSGRTKKRIQRRILHRIDRHYISKLYKLYCQSGVIQRRLKAWGNHEAEVLYPPPDDDRNYKPKIYRPYILALSRLTPMKRMHLLIEAMSRVKNKQIKAIIAGEGEEEYNLNILIKIKNLEKRVKLIGRVTEEEKHKLLMECRAFFFAPYEEDYGIATVEAMKRSKAVITSPDSGGPLDFVRHNETGLIAPPDPENMAEAIDRLARDEGLALRLGKAAGEEVSTISWENVVKKIVVV